ncbi:hypothetical protein A7U60_g6863 [Sanghuangporus baumii]|uniref:Uncharacterized protein n=1 Tax=Sanghuangporus baumii TaxID=108892 RepID=A0A9Q5NA28_SANBA|nr:hypothetical protein A7U60_g6863 [Sanghuangporus baumii]
MSSTRSSVELEGGNEQYDELYEDWYTHTDDSSSSLPLIFATPPLAYMVIKRQTYPHWEKDALKDEVIVRVGGRHDEPDADSKSNISVDRTLTASRVRVTDSAALPTQSTEGEASNSNPNVRRAPSPAITSAHSSQLYAPSPNQSSLFASFAPPHFPPATQFPPLDPRAQKLLEKSSSEVRHQQREQGVIPTFSFSRLQTMVADSATRERSSVLSHLAGLHNQVQGSPQSPSLWRLPFEGEAEEKPDSLKSGRSVDDIGEVESTSVYTKASEDDSDALTDNRWPPKKDERFADIGHTFDDSFIPDCHSSTFSSSGIDEKSRRDASNSSIHSFGFASGSKRTCGHKKHYVRPLQGHDDADSGSENDDDGRDLSFFFRSESRHGSSSINRETPSDHDHIHTHHPREFTDTNVAMEDYAGSERSTRANANASNSSVFGLVPDSRTSSEMYLSPNFLDSDHVHDYFGGGVVIYSAPDSDGGEGRENLDETIEDERDVSKNNHRVYFPTGDGQAKSSRTPFSALQRLVTTTRRRVSNAGGAALGFGSVSRKQSQSQSTRPITQRSAPSAKEELEKSERPQKDTTAMSGNARKRNVLMKRGRSSTVRPLGFRHTTFRSRPLAVLKETKNQEPGHLETRRTSGRFSFIRRLSHLAGASNSSPKSAEQWATEAPKSSGKPEAATAPQLSLPTLQTQEEKRPRAQLDSGAAVLFRRFSLASPRTPGSFRGRRDTNPGDS